MSQSLLIAFAIGTLFSIGTQFYISKGFHDFHHKLPSPNAHIEFLFPFSLIIMGLSNVLNVYTEEKYNLLIGFFVGLFFSTVGISMNLIKFWNITEFQARTFALIYYPVIFFIMSFANQHN